MFQVTPRSKLPRLTLAITYGLAVTLHKVSILLHTHQQWPGRSFCDSYWFGLSCRSAVSNLQALTTFPDKNIFRFLAKRYPPRAAGYSHRFRANRGLLTRRRTHRGSLSKANSLIMRSTCITPPKVNGLSSTILASYPGRSGYRYEASTMYIYACARKQHNDYVHVLPFLNWSRSSS